MNLPELTEVLDEIEFFERAQTDRLVVELAILLYNYWGELPQGCTRSQLDRRRAVGCGGVELGSKVRSVPPAVLLMDETAIKQQGQEFTLFAAVDPETRQLIHASVAPSRNYLTTRRFLTEIAELYGRAPPIVVTDGASYGPVFTRLGVTRITAVTASETVLNGEYRSLNAASRRSTPPSPDTMSKPRTAGFGNSPGSGTSA